MELDDKLHANIKAAQRLKQRLRDIDAEATYKKTAAVNEALSELGALELIAGLIASGEETVERPSNTLLANLENSARAQSDASATVKESVLGRPVDVGAKPAWRIVLEALTASQNPLDSGDLTELLTRLGWTRSAAEKAKTRLRNSGSVVRDGRHYTITETGRKKLMD
ncbi:hypothetical protein [Aliihoeflea sp. 2WW]|uniref:hypothetical protein n=1 Tax=Aliihoeflea sp. 2WW TaxID=1381123 RepID=UPI001268EF11|nr:hypothetical protein [Aliihoeflea sp. 2WW]